MLISITNPIQATWIFSILFFLAIIIFIKPRKISAWFPAEVTTELKGLAILLIVLSHIGYFLVSDTRFLWPLSIAAGVGVDLFLFLSGFGLTASQLKSNLGVKEFYYKRLGKLFLPFWITLIIFFSLDFFLVKSGYSWQYIGRSFLGLFPQADLYHDLNSPFWYFSFIFGYYLVFPWLFSKKYPQLTALALYGLGFLLIYLEPTFLANILHMYKLHIIAFPLGVLVAAIVAHLKDPVVLEKWSRGYRAVAYYLVLLVFLALFVYANINSGIGENVNKHQLMSILAVLAISGVFILKKVELKLFYWFGLYSYEIYLFHWPVMYRYDFLYRFFPAWLATTLYLIFFLALGYGFSKLMLVLTRPKKISAPVK